MTDVDTTAADMLADLDAWLNERGVSLVFAELKDPVREKIERYELDAHDRPGALLPDPRRGGRRLHRPRPARAGSRPERDGADMSRQPEQLAAPSHGGSGLAAWPCARCCGVVVFLVVAGSAPVGRAARRRSRRWRCWWSPAWFALSRDGDEPSRGGRGRGRRSLVVFVVVMVWPARASRVLVVAPASWPSPSVGCRLALLCRRGRRTTARPRLAAAPTPTHAVLIMNPWSGGGKVERFELERRCRERGIEPIVLTPGSDLLALAEDAVAAGRRRHRHGRWRRLAGARGVGGEPARHPVGGRPGGHPQPLRPRPGHRPRGRRRCARRLRRRGRAA